MEELYIIAGLGNPGLRYDNTRHNAGFEAVDLISRQYGIPINRSKHKALIGDGTIEGFRVLLVKPQTFMNASGESVRDLIEWYKLPLGKLIVIYDDVDLQPGKIRVRARGSAGTHNGMKSIIYQLQSDGFPRVRIGIGKQPRGWDLADYVLSKYSAEDRKLAEEGLSAGAKAAVSIVTSGVEAAMNLLGEASKKVEEAAKGRELE